MSVAGPRRTRSSPSLRSTSTPPTWWPWCTRSARCSSVTRPRTRSTLRTRAAAPCSSRLCSPSTLRPSPGRALRSRGSSTACSSPVCSRALGCGSLPARS
eukprot:Amastigsp_a850019_3.p3 type:complete len:100 gc:universal Amastigsp_a850019_3:123-422(+)